MRIKKFESSYYRGNELDNDHKDIISLDVNICNMIANKFGIQIRLCHASSGSFWNTRNGNYIFGQMNYPSYRMLPVDTRLFMPSWLIPCFPLVIYACEDEWFKVLLKDGRSYWCDQEGGLMDFFEDFFYDKLD